jgi:hypothetical protein
MALAYIADALAHSGSGGRRVQALVPGP